jgi:3-hydroxyanthranilic acid dioxygenase
VENPLPTVLRHWILRRFKTVRAFSIAAYGEELGHQKTGHISRILSASRPVPASEVEHWATTLALSEREREQWLLLVAISHVPKEIQASVLVVIERDRLANRQDSLRLLS